MSAIRSRNLYVSNQVHRWLKWMAEIESESGSDAGPKTTPDAIAEKILRDHIAELYPNMAKIEGAYWEARGKLDDMAVKELKGSNT